MSQVVNSALKFAAIVNDFTAERFCELVIIQSWQPLLFNQRLKTMVHSLKARHFQTRILPQFSNLKEQWFLLTILLTFNRFLSREDQISINHA